MNKYTVIYTESWMVGNHQATITKMIHVEASSPDEAIKPFDGAAIFVFPGHLTSL